MMRVFLIWRLFLFQAKLDKSHNGKPSRVIHIRNIANEVSEGEIIQLGMPFGRVTNVLVLKGKNQVRLSNIVPDQWLERFCCFELAIYRRLMGSHDFRLSEIVVHRKSNVINVCIIKINLRIILLQTWFTFKIHTFCASRFAYN